MLPAFQRPFAWLAGLLMLLFPFALRAQEVHYSPAWFGPNANPVPQFADGTIPARTTLALGGNYYFGFGDLTGNLTFDVEVPLLPECVSLRVWLNTLEYYRVTPGVHAERLVFPESVLHVCERRQQRSHEQHRQRSERGSRRGDAV